MDRRNMIKHTILAATGFGAASIARGSSLNSCESKPNLQQPEGPFYPINSQIDTDADLIQVEGSRQLASGRVILVQGVLTDQNCAVVPGALVEIWQACESGKYNHPSDPNTAPLDPNFQYWGKAVTDQNGFYRFRTIVPGAYPADRNWIRPPHIHFKVAKIGYIELITQMYFAGEHFNREDLILKRLPISEQQKVIVPLVENAELKIPLAQFNIQIEKL